MSVDSDSDTYDLAVIGSGPGGYTAAIRGAQLGATTVLIEEKSIGGTCTNVGCVPTKTLLRLVKILSEVRRVEGSGLNFNKINVDYSKLMQRKNEIISNLSKGIELLLKNNGVRIISGRGNLTKDKRIEVYAKGIEKRNIRANNIIIGTGSEPAIPPIPGLDGKNIIFDEDASNIEQIPSELAIIGGGPEGVEFAYIYSILGSDVTVLEMMPTILPREDHEIARRLQLRMFKEMIKIETNAKVVSIKDSEKKKIVCFEQQGVKKILEVDKVLAMFGRIPRIKDLGLEVMGIKINNGKIEVNERMETNISGIYAIGDVTGGAYAHEAVEEGIVAAENACNYERKSVMDWRVIPRCFFTIPQAAAVGLTEKEALEKGHDLKIGKFYFAANAAAMTMGDTDGLVKFIIDDNSKKILGIHILGPDASELIAEATLLMKLNAPFEQIIKTVHAHPTLSEAIKEAAMDVEGLSIHKFKKQKMQS